MMHEHSQSKHLHVSEFVQRLLVKGYRPRTSGEYEPVVRPFDVLESDVEANPTWLVRVSPRERRFELLLVTEREGSKS